MERKKSKSKRRHKRLIDMHPKTRETCFNCNHKFNDTDAVYLGLLDGHKNEIFCEKCAKEISETFEKSTIIQRCSNLYQH